jgi:ribosomal small subunit protein bTHX
MGKGDKKSKKGKRFRNSYGNIRPKKNNIVPTYPSGQVHLFNLV